MFRTFGLAVCVLFFLCSPFIVTVRVAHAQTAPTISGITDNRSDYPNSQIPRYRKYELTFSVGTNARTLEFPYDPNRPQDATDPNFTKAIYHGISVDAIFTNPQGIQYRQPAFSYQVFEDQVKGTREWFYPTNQYKWKVRFSPNQTGTWQYRLVATDENGTGTTADQPFVVTGSVSHGFIVPSRTDPRYFEYDDGTYFPGMGYNFQLDSQNPTLGNTPEFSAMGPNGIELSRVWVSQLSIYGEAYGKWGSNNRVHGTQEPRYGIVAPNNYQFAQLYPGFVPPSLPRESEYYMWLEYDAQVSPDQTQQHFTPCRYIADIPVKQNTQYRVKVRYQARNLEGPKVSGFPYGFAIKTTSDFYATAGRCNDRDAGSVIAATYNAPQVQPDPANPGWMILTGTYANTTSDFLKYLYVSFDNVQSTDSDARAGHVFVDRVWMEEANCTTGCPNLISKPYMSMHQYINQRDAYSLDKILRLAEQYGLYLKTVMLEKNDRILGTIGFDGSQATTPSVTNFYGNRRVLTKVRWLQQAWWRYMQARWGYSPHIHSWELMNEGHDGNTEGHWDMADEFGKYMHCRVFGVAVSSANPYEDCQYNHPNDHMVSTSFFNSSYPWQFWNNQASGVNLTYAEMDYVDQHYYANVGDTSQLAGFYDSAQFSYNLSMLSSNFAPGKRKPFIRGETAWSFTAPAPRDVFGDNTDGGEWLHDYIWAGVNPGGLMEHYFATSFWTKHFYNLTASPPYDHRPMYKSYYDFIKDVPLSNGRYADAAASSTNPAIRAWGQKDTTNRRAHLWIANKNHTWYNKIGGYPGGPAPVGISPVSGTVSVGGFIPNTAYTVQWWDTYGGTVASTQTKTSTATGNIDLTITNLSTDIAVKISGFGLGEITPTPGAIAGDANGDGHVNGNDYYIWLTNYGTTVQNGSGSGDFNGDLSVNGADYFIWLTHYGT
jgi:hypothetical protein